MGLLDPKEPLSVLAPLVVVEAVDVREKLEGYEQQCLVMFWVRCFGLRRLHPNPVLAFARGKKVLQHLVEVLLCAQERLCHMEEYMVETLVWREPERSCFESWKLVKIFWAAPLVAIVLPFPLHPCFRLTFVFQVAFCVGKEKRTRVSRKTSYTKGECKRFAKST